jgi:hypothetical protein
MCLQFYFFFVCVCDSNIAGNAVSSESSIILRSPCISHRTKLPQPDPQGNPKEFCAIFRGGKDIAMDDVLRLELWDKDKHKREEIIAWNELSIQDFVDGRERFGWFSLCAKDSSEQAEILLRVRHTSANF